MNIEYWIKDLGNLAYFDSFDLLLRDYPKNLRIYDPEFEKNAAKYQKANSLDPTWTTWVNSHINYLFRAYIKTRSMGKTMRIGVAYAPGFALDTPWLDENDHMKLLEEAVGVYFLGWKIQCEFVGDKWMDLFKTMNYGNNDNVDILIRLGNPAMSFGTSIPPHASLHYEGSISHELAHTLGLHYHHYSGSGLEIPLLPNETCSLAKTPQNGYCSVCRFALNIDMGPVDYQKSVIIFNQINSHYPSNW